MDVLPFVKPARFKINCFCAVTLVIQIVAVEGISLNAQATYRTYHQGGHGAHQLSESSFNDHFENYYSSNSYLTDEQKAIYEDYWMCILSGRTDDIVRSLQWTASHGQWDDYFMALNYLVYVHDNHLKSPHLLGIIEDLIDHSVQQNVLSSSVLQTNSVTYNIVKYLFERFWHTSERLGHVAYSEVDYTKPSQEDIGRLIAALGSSHEHLTHHSIMSNYLQNMPSLIYRQVDFKQAPRLCLKQIISLLLNGNHKLSANLYHACQYYIQLFNNQEMEHQTRLRNLEITTQLLQFIPAFNSTHRQVLTSFLTSGSMINELVKLCGHPVVTESYLYNLMHKGLSLSGVTDALREAFQFYLHYFQNLSKLSNLSHQLPQFVNSPGKEYYQQLVEVMNGPITKEALISSEIVSLETKSNHLLQDTLRYYKTDSHFSESIHTAASYYLGYYDILAVRQKYSLDALFSIIPQPSDETDMYFYENMQSLFGSMTFLQIIRESNLQVSTDHRHMLHDVLNLALQSSYSTMECKSAILHYFRVMYNEGLSVEEARKVELLIQELKSVNIESRMYAVLTQFLQTDFVYLVAQYGHIDFSQQIFHVLEEMCKTITQMDFLDTNIKESASYIASRVHQFYEQETQVMSRVYQAFNSLQGAANGRVEKYEASLDVFLQCEEMHTILRHGHFDVNKDSRELLYDLLMIILEDANVSVEVREGAYYYCKYILEPLLGNVPCDMAELLKLLPLPSNHVTHSYFNILRNYLYLGVPRFITAHIDFTKTRVDLLLDILQALVYSDRIPVDVRGTAKYYWHFFNTRNDRVSIEVLSNKLDRLTLLLPKPTSAYEAQYYNLMVSYLKGKLILKLLNTININLHKPDIKILRDIIVLTLNTKFVYMDFKIVARYYLNKIDNGVICDIGNEEYANMQASTIAAAQTTMNTHYAITANYARAATINTAANNAYRYQTQATQGTLGTTIYQDMGVYNDQTAVTSAPIASTPATPTTAHVALSSSATTGTTLAATQQATMSTASTSHQAETSNISMSTATSTTTSTAVLTAQQTTVLEKIETELNSMTVGQENAANQHVLQSYVKTPTAYKLLETSGVDLEAPGSALLADFVQIAAHTNDIPVDLRLASERYELAIPSLKQIAIVTPYTHLISLDNIFHTIPVPVQGQAQENLVLCYNAIDRYLHTEVPSIIMHGAHIDLKVAPIELLQDFMMIAQECHLSQQDKQTIDTLIQQSRGPTEGTDTPLLDHLYRLHKVFQLLVFPDQADGADYYYTLDGFFRSSTIYEIMQSNIDFNIELTDLLKSILNLVINANPTLVSNNIVQAAVYYNNLMFTHVNEKELDIVFHLVPIPEGEREVQAFNTVNEYIHSPNADVISQNVNFDTHRAPSAILTNVLDLASHSVKVKPNVREASSILLNKLRTSNLISTASTGTIHAQKMVYLHSSVHSMSSVVSTTSTVVTTTSQYINLLNILPQGFTATEDYKFLNEYFGQLSQTTMDSMFTQEELSMMSGNEEGLLRLILLKLVHDTTVSMQVRVACAHLIKQRYFDFGVFVSYIPAAKLPEEHIYSALLTQFFTGDDIYRYCHLVTTTYNTDLDSFKLILTGLSTNEEVSAEIRRACSYYLSHAPFIDFSILVDLLPVGTSHNIQKLRATMVHFLTTPELINSCIQNINLSNYGTANGQFLKELLLLAEKCDTLDESIRVAAKYFLTVIKPVAVSVQKVLTRTLDLGEIFNDVFDFSSFTKIQFDAFHTFWSYVSERTQEILSSPGFDFWSENNKRGVFTTKFLQALDLKAEVPKDIHESIAILTPLIHTDLGGGLDV